MYVGADKRVFREYLASKKPDKIWISCGLTYTYKGAVEVIDICKEIYPDVEVVLGGIYPTLCYDHARENTRADTIVKGDYVDFSTCAMDYDVLVNKPDYIVRQFSKGCPNGCKFCAVSSLDGRRVKAIDVDMDIAEIDRLTSKYETNKVRVWSSNALIPERGKTFEAWLDGIISLDKGLRILFPEGFAPELLSRKLCKKMLKAGFMDLYIPLEDASDSSRKEYIGKKYETRQWEKAVEEACMAGFRKDQIKTPIIFGMPGQKPNSLIEAIRILDKSGVRGVGYPYTPVPGSEWYEASERFKGMDLEHLYGALLPAIEDYDTYRMTVELCTYLMDDMACGINSRRKELLINTDEGEDGMIKKDMIDKMATLIIDIAEQNEEILNKTAGFSSEISEIKKRLTELEARKGE
jgi:radical SAM superfamily enzyme YgiQ (UPF0313 family)